MRMPPREPRLPSATPLTSFLSGFTAACDVQSADVQNDLDSRIRLITDPHDADAVVVTSRWGHIVIEASSAPAAKALQYCTRALIDAAMSAGITDPSVSVRVRRSR